MPPKSPSRENLFAARAHIYHNGRGHFGQVSWPDGVDSPA